MGPGDSARSHAPDEFIYRKELREGVSGYLEAIDTVAKTYQK
jgi:acetylornithine deacetylase